MFFKTTRNSHFPILTFDSPSRLAITARIFDTGPSVNVEGPPDHLGAEADAFAEPFAAAAGAASDGADTSHRKNKFFK